MVMVMVVVVIVRMFVWVAGVCHGPIMARLGAFCQLRHALRQLRLWDATQSGDALSGLLSPTTSAGIGLYRIYPAANLARKAK